MLPKSNIAKLYSLQCSKVPSGTPKGQAKSHVFIANDIVIWLLQGHSVTRKLNPDGNVDTV